MGKLIKNNNDLIKNTNYIKEQLREQREKECFSVVNRGGVWYDTLNNSQKEDLKAWYNAWLDVTKTLAPPVKPSWL